MQAREIMTENQACCLPDTSLKKVALLMVENDCGCISIVDRRENKNKLERLPTAILPFALLPPDVIRSTHRTPEYQRMEKVLRQINSGKDSI